MASMIFGTVIGPIQMIQYREESNPKYGKIKQNIIRLLNRMILTPQETA